MAVHEPQRCEWVLDDAVYRAYHDEEWGVPIYDDRVLFEFLILEGAQAGLSWKTILDRRAGYRRAFAGFDARRVAAFGPGDEQRLLADPGIIRNRLKIAAAVTNAQAFLRVQEECGSFSAYQWQFVGDRPRQNRRNTPAEIPVTTPESDALSKDLKQRGFKFVGPTIMYAHMQAVGMVNDHLTGCFRHAAVAALVPA